MLDAFIIERIRRQREEAEQDRRAPVQIRMPTPPPPEQDRRSERRSEPEERGVVEIDFSI